MTNLERKAMEMALEALEDYRFASGFERPLAQDAIDELRQALAQPEQVLTARVVVTGEKISLSRVKIGERFVLVRTGQIYSKTKNGYWNESERRPSRLHLNCQVQLIKEKNT